MNEEKLYQTISEVLADAKCLENIIDKLKETTNEGDILNNLGYLSGGINGIVTILSNVVKIHEAERQIMYTTTYFESLPQ